MQFDCKCKKNTNLQCNWNVFDQLMRETRFIKHDFTKKTEDILYKIFIEKYIIINISCFMLLVINSKNNSNKNNNCPKSEYLY